MNRDELKERIAQQLRTLRDATDQKSAVAWMKGAYLLLEQAMYKLDAPEPAQPAFRFSEPTPAGIITPEANVFCLPSSPLARRPGAWPGPTVVYQDVPQYLEKPKPEPIPRPTAPEVGLSSRAKKRAISRNFQYGNGR